MHRWLATGVALGAGGTIWAKRRLGALQGRLEPSRVAGDLAGRHPRTGEGGGRSRAGRRRNGENGDPHEARAVVRTASQARDIVRGWR